jgi:hypothetical protein
MFDELQYQFGSFSLFILTGILGGMLYMLTPLPWIPAFFIGFFLARCCLGSFSSAARNHKDTSDSEAPKEGSRPTNKKDDATNLWRVATKAAPSE